MRSSLGHTLAFVRTFEGGYVNDPKDPGGCTNLGITLATWRANGHAKATCATLQRIQWARDAAPIYVASYWSPVQADLLPSGVDLLICDHAVNAGVSRAVRLLQSVVGADVDGDLGPQTRAAVDRVSAQDLSGLIEATAEERRAYYKGRPARLRKRFLRGWLSRVDSAEALALSLAGVL